MEIITHKSFETSLFLLVIFIGLQFIIVGGILLFRFSIQSQRRVQFDFLKRLVRGFDRFWYHEFIIVKSKWNTLYRYPHPRFPFEKMIFNLIKRILKYINSKRLLVFLILNALLLLAFIQSIYSLISVKPTVVQTFPNDSSILLSYDQPIDFEFNVPIDVQRINPNISPEIPGKWTYELYADFIPYTRHISFTPEESFSPGEKVIVYLSNITTPFHPQLGNEYGITFIAHPSPEILSTLPSDGSADISANTEASIFLDVPINDYTEFSYSIEPNTAIELDQTTTENSKEINLQFSDGLKQGTTYTIIVNESTNSQNLKTGEITNQTDPLEKYRFSFTTVYPPNIQNTSPSGTGVFVDTPLSITFDNPMITSSVEKNFEIIPEIDGEFSWNETNTTVSFISQKKLEKDTTYTINIHSGASNKDGGVIEDGISYSFTTIGKVHVIGNSPTSSSTALTSSIQISFDQAVDHFSAESLFSVSPHINGSFSWSGNMMTFTPSSSYSYETNYSYSLQKGVKSINGLDSDTAFSSSFLTAPQIFRLDVPFYYQNEDFTCNIASARMTLAYYGIYVSEDTLKNLAGNGGERGSGNPNVGYVSGFGTFWGPISQAVSHYRSNELVTNMSLETALNHVQNGNPVEIWGQNGWSSPIDISWTASDGTYIYAVSGMHSVVIIGFEGTPQNPRQVLVNDPWRGQRWLTPTKLRSNWSYYNMAMVVY